MPQKTCISIYALTLRTLRRDDPRLLRFQRQRLDRLCPIHVAHRVLNLELVRVLRLRQHGFAGAPHALLHLELAGDTRCDRECQLRNWHGRRQLRLGDLRAARAKAPLYEGAFTDVVKAFGEFW